MLEKKKREDKNLKASTRISSKFKVMKENRDSILKSASSCFDFSSFTNSFRQSCGGRTTNSHIFLFHSPIHYIFPPFPLNLKNLKKVQEDQAIETCKLVEPPHFFNL